MDHDSLDLIAGLCTRAGMIMEDSSVLPLALPPADAQALTLSLAELSEAVEDIGALIAAAKSIVRDASRESFNPKSPQALVQSVKLVILPPLRFLKNSVGDEPGGEEGVPRGAAAA